MDVKKNVIIKYTVAVLAVLNLIWLFGFGYQVPGLESNVKTEEMAEAATTASTMATAEEEVAEEPVEEEPKEEVKVVKCRVTAATRLNIRMGPGTNYEVVGTANYNEILTVLRMAGFGFVMIRGRKDMYRKHMQRFWTNKKQNEKVENDMFQLFL